MWCDICYVTSLSSLSLSSWTERDRLDHVMWHILYDFSVIVVFVFCVVHCLLGILFYPHELHMGMCNYTCCSFCWPDRLVGLVVKASASRAEDPGFESRLSWNFLMSSHTSDLKNGTPVATLPGVWRYRVRAETGWPGVSILWPGEMESLVCNFCLSVAARTIVWADLSLRYTRMLLGR